MNKQKITKLLVIIAIILVPIIRFSVTDSYIVTIPFGSILLFLMLMNMEKPFIVVIYIIGIISMTLGVFFLTKNMMYGLWLFIILFALPILIKYLRMFSKYRK